jgi:LysM repeat protein
MVNAVATGGPKKQDVLVSPKSTSQEEELGENIADLSRNIDKLASDMHRLQKEIELLKSNGDSFSAMQATQAKKIAEEVHKQYDIMGIVDQKVNVLSLAFSQEINTLSEKISNAFNATISVINAQQKLSNVVAGSETKQSEGSVYAVEVGETLDSIATKFKTTREAIKRLNFIPDENHLPVGLMLFIPQTQSSSLVK